MIFLVLGKSHSADKCKRGHLGVFEHPFFGKMEKNEGGPSGDIKKICEKSLTKSKTNLHKKNFGHGGTRTHVILLVRPRKSRSGQVAVK